MQIPCIGSGAVQLSHSDLLFRDLKKKLQQGLNGSISYAITKINRHCPPNFSC